MGVLAGEGGSTELDREPSTAELGLNPRRSHRSLSRWWGLSDLGASRGPVADGTNLEGQMGLAMPPHPAPTLLGIISKEVVFINCWQCQKSV